jgi:hypothetical protein
MLAVIRDEQADLQRRDDMAKAAAPHVHPRLAATVLSSGDRDFVPLAERLKEYAREDAMEASEGRLNYGDDRPDGCSGVCRS